jgi:hypothetical protein
MFEHFPKPQPHLDPEAHDLDGEDLQIARVLAEETERARQETLQQKLAALSPEERAEEIVNMAAGLLGDLRTTREQSITADAMRQPWDTLLRGLSNGSHTRAAERARVSLERVLEVAAKCRPQNWEALFWYTQWVSQALKLSVPWTEAREMVRAAQAQFETNYRSKQSERAKARYAQDRDGKQAAKASVKQWWERWQQAPSLYPSVAAFARAMLDKYPDNLTSQPVIEQWVRDWKSEARG